MYKLFKFNVFLILIGILASCANIPTSLQQFAPEISLKDFKLVKLGLLEQDYRLKLQLKNPNPVPIPITGLTYKLQINGKEFTTGSSDKAITIPANGEEFLEIDVASNLMSIMGQWKDFKSLLNKKFEYDLSGGVNIMDTAAEIPFSYKGDVSLLRD